MEKKPQAQHTTSSHGRIIRVLRNFNRALILSSCTHLSNSKAREIGHQLWSNHLRCHFVCPSEKCELICYCWKHAVSICGNVSDQICKMQRKSEYKECHPILSNKNFRNAIWKCYIGLNQSTPWATFTHGSGGVRLGKVWFFTGVH